MAISVVGPRALSAGSKRHADTRTVGPIGDTRQTLPFTDTDSRSEWPTPFPAGGLDEQ